MKQPINDLKTKIVMNGLEKLSRRDLELLAFHMYLQLSCYYRVTGFRVELDPEGNEGIPVELLERSIECFDNFVDHVADRFIETPKGN